MRRRKPQFRARPSISCGSRDDVPVPVHFDCARPTRCTACGPPLSPLPCSLLAARCPSRPRGRRRIT
ncbi:hypothetical protein B0H15DRAFT_1019422 [Mycena belliarum]|uniref:Uncharacterized protein n=1 Tax=Mycena belliarum TaxID=1033014 RepID=A0AAD6UH97_9AGAR|nr:hypothetical protein B0H15DRAFT_1019422 [Mycena belliae]